MNKSICIGEYKEEYVGPVTLTDVDHSLITKIRNKVRIKRYQDGILIQTRSYIGSIRLSKLSIKIKPKFDIKQIAKMIEYSNQFGDIYDQLVEFEPGDEDIDSFIMKMFLMMVSTLQRKGFARSYMPIVENMTSIRGRLQLREQIINTAKGNIQFVCKHDEFVYDIPENRIILFCLERCRNMVDGKEANRFTIFINMLLDLGVQRIQYADVSYLDKMKYTNTTIHYKDLHKLCRLILNNTSIENFYTDSSEQILAFLVDMNALFEIFVAELFMRHYTKTKRAPHPVAWESKNKKIKIKPDILVGKNQIIIDTKYKHDSDNFLNRDRYQLAFYGHFFKKNIVYAILPEESDSDENYMLKAKEHEVNIKICFINIKKVLNMIKDDKDGKSTRIKEYLDEMLLPDNGSALSHKIEVNK